MLWLVMIMISVSVSAEEEEGNLELGSDDLYCVMRMGIQWRSATHGIDPIIK